MFFYLVFVLLQLVYFLVISVLILNVERVIVSVDGTLVLNLDIHALRHQNIPLFVEIDGTLNLCIRLWELKFRFVVCLIVSYDFYHLWLL